MTRLFLASSGPSDWRSRLGDPVNHWVRGRSAMEAALSWEGRRASPSGLPEEIERAFAAHERFADPVLLFAAIEHKVALDNRRRPSQNDLWLALRTATAHASVAVEAKAGEDFDRPVGDWLREDSDGKRQRLAFLCDSLRLPQPPDPALRYQLFHRSASAVIEARRLRFPLAVMLVQSFAESSTSWQDYAAFARALGLEVERGRLSNALDLGDVQLFLGWVDSPLATDEQIARAL